MGYSIFFWKKKALLQFSTYLEFIKGFDFFRENIIYFFKWQVIPMREKSNIRKNQFSTLSQWWNLSMSIRGCSPVHLISRNVKH